MHQGCTNDELQGSCAYWCKQEKIQLSWYAPARPWTILEFVQSMVKGGGQ